MTRSLVWWLLLLAAASAATPVLAAETTGSVAGTVRDADTLEPIVGAAVGEGSGLYNTRTEADGTYLLDGIPAGAYPINAWTWGYNSTGVEDVEVAAGQTTILDFVLSRMDPALEPVALVHSTDPARPWPDADCRRPAMTPDGRFIVFDSAASNLVAGDTNGQDDVFLFDCTTYGLTLISKTADGTPANGASNHASISADGRYVAFSSDATDLLPGLMTAGQTLAYIYDRETGEVALASVGDDGAVPNNDADGGVSADGRRYYFRSSATNLDPTDASSASKVFVRDLTSGRTWRVDLGFDGSPANGYSYVMGFTPDGRYLLFHSPATNFVPDDTNSKEDLFVYDSLSGLIERADVAADGSQLEGPLAGGALSDNGRSVAFSATDQDLWPDLVYEANSFVRDRTTGAVELVGVLPADSALAQNPETLCIPMDMSADGRLVVFYAYLLSPNAVFPVYVRDRATGQTIACPLNRDDDYWVFSANGRFLVAPRRIHDDDPMDLYLWEPALLSFGTLQGTVRDDSGAPVPHADLWIGDGLYMRADAAGAFSIDVPVAESTTLRVSADGYVATSVDGLAITEGETVAVDVTLSRDFSDVGDTSWAEQSVSACLEAGIVGGYADGSYHPSESVTRGQMAVYIARALAGGDGGVAPPRPGTQSFSDVPADHWAFRYIQSCSAESVVQGYSDGSYQPDAIVNRGQMAVYIARAMVSPTGDAAVPDPPAGDPTFSDVTADNEWSWCEKHVEYLASHGVVQGYADGSYHPAEAVTRDQMAVYIQRAFQLPM